MAQNFYNTRDEILNNLQIYGKLILPAGDIVVNSSGSIQAAIDSLAGTNAQGRTISISPGTYVENLVIENFSAGPSFESTQAQPVTSGFSIVGDPRWIAGATYMHGLYQSVYTQQLYDSDTNPTQIVGYSPPLGTLHGNVTITNVGSSPSNVVAVTITGAPALDIDTPYGFPGVIQQPDFVACGIVVGDHVLIKDADGLITELSITAVSGNQITLNGSVDLGGNNATLTFCPNVKVLNKSGFQNTCSISGPSLTLRGIRFSIDPSASNVQNNLFVMGPTTIDMSGCLIDDLPGLTASTVLLNTGCSINGYEVLGSPDTAPGTFSTLFQYNHNSVVTGTSQLSSIFPSPVDITYNISVAQAMLVSGANVAGGTWDVIGATNVVPNTYSGVFAQSSVFSPTTLRINGYVIGLTSQQSEISTSDYLNVVGFGAFDSEFAAGVVVYASSVATLANDFCVIDSLDLTSPPPPTSIGILLSIGSVFKMGDASYSPGITPSYAYFHINNVFWGILAESSHFAHGEVGSSIVQFTNVGWMVEEDIDSHIDAANTITNSDFTIYGDAGGIQYNVSAPILPAEGLHLLNNYYGPHNMTMDLIGNDSVSNLYFASPYEKKIINIRSDYGTRYFNVTPVADVNQSLAGKYWEFTTSPANATSAFYVWYQVSGVGVDPAPAGRSGIQINISTNDTAVDIANETASQLQAYFLPGNAPYPKGSAQIVYYPGSIGAFSNPATFEFRTRVDGACIAGVDVDSGFTISSVLDPTTFGPVITEGNPPGDIFGANAQPHTVSLTDPDGNAVGVFYGTGIPYGAYKATFAGTNVGEGLLIQVECDCCVYVLNSFGVTFS